MKISNLQRHVDEPHFNINFVRLNDTAISPTKEHLEDAGWDLYANESVNLEFAVPRKVKTGISFGHPPCIHGFIWDRSSMGTKGIHVLGGLIDCPYTGEVSVILVNLNKNEPNQPIGIGTKMTQVVFPHLPITHLIETKTLEETSRGDKGFGSSGS